MSYHQLDKEIEKQIANDRENHVVNQCRFHDKDALRRNMERDKNNTLRPSFARDIDKILHLPLYNRYNDKTQVFSFYHNDDITRRGLHVQLVSRIGRNIGRLLGLNLDLIEAIALGHDIGHTPFGHAGERFLDEIYFRETGRHFLHNIHSARVLDKIFNRNISLQVLDGIICHNGEFELSEYRPESLNCFEEYDRRVEACYLGGNDEVKKLIPSTLEGCVVRISDIIAYVGKDRQDAVIARIIDENEEFTDDFIGNKNAEMINNLVVDIVDHSYGKDYLCMSPEAFSALSVAKKENYKKIYQNTKVESVYIDTIKPMFEELYYKLLEDVKEKNEDSLIYRHHISFVEKNAGYYKDEQLILYRDEDPNMIVVDYIASMTDDYFVTLHKKLFPDSGHSIEYKSYFED